VEIYLMRHGIAVEGLSGPWRTDESRPLSEDGIHETGRAGRGLAAAGIGFDRIFSSPLVRARQTAEVVAAESGSAPGSGASVPGVEELEALAPGLAPAELMKSLRHRLGSEASRVLLVGHQPDMGLLAAWLLDLPGGHSLPFAKGSIARIDIDGLPPSRAGRRARGPTR
jgi:phosphohistidine phosphatase